MEEPWHATFFSKVWVSRCQLTIREHCRRLCVHLGLRSGPARAGGTWHACRSLHASLQAAVTVGLEAQARQLNDVPGGWHHQVKMEALARSEGSLQAQQRCYAKKQKQSADSGNPDSLCKWNVCRAIVDDDCPRRCMQSTEQSQRAQVARVSIRLRLTLSSRLLKRAHLRTEHAGTVAPGTVTQLPSSPPTRPGARSRATMLFRVLSSAH